MFRIDKMAADGKEIQPSSYDGRPVGKSTLYGPDGQVKLTWVREKAGEPGPEQIAQAIRDALDGVHRPEPVATPKQTLRDLLTCYPIGDAHFGMYSWAEETGADYDLKIAERLLVAAVTHLVNLAPPSDEALFVDVGDFAHYDNIRGQTERNANALDVDTRYHAMIRCVLRTLCAGIDMALTKHKTVTVACTPGNHNDMGAAWMIEALALYYSRNRRVKVLTKAGKFLYHEFGKVLIGVTHGDTGKPEKLAGVMAADQPEAWGRTVHRHWLTGHVHNKSQLELPGVLWETFRTLAPRDAWANAAGYRAGRDMQAIVYHREHGEVARHCFNVGMLE